MTSPIDAESNDYGNERQYSRDVYGLVALADPLRASYHKVQRNAKYDIAENKFDYDNYWVQHEIPRTDYQYAWVSASHDPSISTSSLNRHLLHWLTSPTGSSTYHPRDDIWANYAIPSQSLHERRARLTTAYQDSVYINGTVAEAETYIGMTSYGFPSWEEVRLTDMPENVKIKKTYGYNYVVNEGVTSNITPSTGYIIGTVKKTVRTVDESRVIFNYPNDTTLSRIDPNSTAANRGGGGTFGVTQTDPNRAQTNEIAQEVVSLLNQDGNSTSASRALELTNLCTATYCPTIRNLQMLANWSMQYNCM